MEEKMFGVPAINCQHCVLHIRREVAAIEGVAEVSADEASRLVTVRWRPPASWSAIRATLAEIGYPPVE